MEPALLDALRRHEADLALVHVAVVVRIEAGAAVELELEQFGRRSSPSLYAGWLPAGEYCVARSFPLARKYTVTAGRLPLGLWCSMTALPPLTIS